MADRLSSILQLTCATGALMISGAASAQETETDRRSSVGEVVITAERRETNLQTTPVAVTALTADAIEGNRIQDLGDLNNLAPGLVANVSGTMNTIQYNLRGVTSTAFLPGQSGGVGTYIDGVYLGLNAGKVSELADIERIEVLRGPQGTLFGRNANGGAISITTRLPSGEFGVNQQLSIGNFSQFRSRTRVDLPAWGPFTASVTYLHDEREGDTRNLGAGTAWDWGPVTQGLQGIRVSPETMGDRESDAFAATLRFEPNDQWDIIYRGDWHELEYTDRGTAVIGDPNNLASAFPFGVPAEYALIPAALRTPVTMTRPEAVNNSFVTPVPQEGSGHSLTVNYRMNDTISFRNITAYREVEIAVNSMLDAARGGAPVTAGVPFVVQGSSSWNVDDMFSNELQMFVTTNPFDLTVGLYYFENTASNGPRIEPGSCASGACISTTSTQPYVISQLNQLRSSVDTTSTAIYAQGNIHLTDRLDLQLGVRHTNDEQEGVDNLSGFTINQVYENDEVTWLAGVNYELTDSVFVYAKASTGFISGGQLAGINYLPEYATSYEVGIKADLFDRRLRTNLAVFDTEYENLQQAGLLAGAGPAGGGLTVIFDVGDAEVRGVELEATWLPPGIEGLTLSGTLSHVDFEFTRFNPTFLLFNGLTAAQMQSNTPEWTGNLAIQYETAPLSFGGSFLARLDANYRGDTNLANSWRTPAQRAVLQADARTLLNGRIGFVDIPMGAVNADITLWGRNLSDEDGPSSVTFIGYNSAQFEEERTYGIDLTFDF